MSLYAIGDLHLHFSSQLRAANQLTDPAWRGHEEKLRRNCLALLKPEDTLVLVGDHTWGKNLEESEKDFGYICSLPGRKILLRGNHDRFWDVKKTAALNGRFAGRLCFLQNNYYAYGETALVGTKGYCFEGPFLVRGRRILDWDREKEQEGRRLAERELDRLQLSFEAAMNDGFTDFILFLHYPPTSILENSSGFTKMAEKYRVRQVVYAHCHGASRFRDSLLGVKNGIRYSLVSGDYLDWRPLKLL